MGNGFRIVSLGDSVVWGQGLLPEQKFVTLIQEALAPGTPVESLAHSGAVIGAAGATGIPEPGEVPTSRLTIIEQCDQFSNAPDDVGLVILNGGINDVGAATILNPLAVIPTLDSRITRACHDGMLTLLRKVSAKFSRPDCKILVTGYYPILSALSDPIGVTKLLAMFGIAMPWFIEDTADFINPVLARCARFFTKSNAELERAVEDADDARIRFVPSGFTDKNSVFVADTSLLWGLNIDDDLGPEDPMATARRPLCETAHPAPEDLLKLETCYRAAAGHPNVQGAIQFSRQILGAL